MSVAINRVTMEFIGRGEYRVLWAKATEELGLAPEAIVIGEELGRLYSVFTDMELRLLYRNTTGLQFESAAYEALVLVCKGLGNQLPIIPTPPELIRVVNRITPATKKSAPVAKRDPAKAGQSLRPKAGTATGQVWDIADEQYASAENKEAWKALRATILGACEEAGINLATAQVQFGKWKASKLQETPVDPETENT